jgi:hypothetical protein
MRAALGAFAAGWFTIARAPGVVLVVWLATLLLAIPFGVVLADRLRDALAHQPPISLASEEIDADWWAEYRESATGLEATFTPAILGFAAPLENLSALFDATPRPAVLALPILLYLMVWAFLWGAVLARFGEPRRSLRASVAAGQEQFAQMLSVSLAAGAVTGLLYVTLHPLLFGPVFDALASLTSTDRDAFFVRVALYACFAAPLALVGLVTDYTRIRLMTAPGLRHAAGSAVAFLRAHWTAALSLYLLTAMTFVALLAVYGVADRRLGGWRAVLAGQAFVMGRLVIRLVGAASQVHLATDRRLEHAGD